MKPVRHLLDYGKNVLDKTHLAGVAHKIKDALVSSISPGEKLFIRPGYPYLWTVHISPHMRAHKSNLVKYFLPATWKL